MDSGLRLLQVKYSFSRRLYFAYFVSLAVSVKMNILLSAPGLLLLLIEACGWIGTIKNLTLCALIQVIISVTVNL